MRDFKELERLRKVLSVQHARALMSYISFIKDYDAIL